MKRAEFDFRTKYMVERIKITKDIQGNLKLNKEKDRLERKSTFHVLVHIYPPFESVTEKLDWYYEAEMYLESKMQEAIEEYIKKYYQSPQDIVIIEKIAPKFLGLRDFHLSSMFFHTRVWEIEHL